MMLGQIIRHCCYGAEKMRFAFYGLLIAALIFAVSGGHLLFLPLFYVLPLGGLFGHRRRHRSLRPARGRR